LQTKIQLFTDRPNPDVPSPQKSPQGLCINEAIETQQKGAAIAASNHRENVF
jgi:hypothetical protein